MDLLLDADQSELVETTRALLRDHAEDAFPRSAELGWFALGVAEEHGGVGYGLAEETVVFRELGRARTAGSFLGTVLAAHLATAAAAPIAPDLLAGVRRAGIAQREGDRWRLFDADATGLVVAVEPERARLLAAAVPETSTISAIDETVRVDVLDLDDAEVLAERPGGDVWNRGSVLVAAQLCGLADGARDLASDHARERQQFGRAIGTFQAISHRCADMAVRCEAAWCSTWVAALRTEIDHPRAARDRNAARIVATSAAIRNAADGIQIHGGIGFAREHAAHQFVTRARVLEHELGSLPSQRAALLHEP